MKKIRAVMLVGVLSVCMVAIPAKAKEEVVITDEVIAISEELGQQYNICPELIEAITWVESRCKPEVVGGTCVGAMQINERWHRDRMKKLGVTNLYDLRQNMSVGVNLLAELFEKYEDAGLVLMAYNGTPNIAEMAEIGELTEYAEKILEVSAELEKLHGK